MGQKNTSLPKKKLSSSEHQRSVVFPPCEEENGVEVKPSLMGKKKDGLILETQYFPSIYVLSKSNEL